MFRATYIHIHIYIWIPFASIDLSTHGLVNDLGTIHSYYPTFLYTTHSYGIKFVQILLFSILTSICIFVIRTWTQHMKSQKYQWKFYINIIMPENFYRIIVSKYPCIVPSIVNISYIQSCAFSYMFEFQAIWFFI